MPLGFSLAIVIAGAAVLARSPLLLALMAGEQRGVAAGERNRASRQGQPPRQPARARAAPAQREPVSAASDSAESPSEPSRETRRSTPATEALDPLTPTTSTSPGRARR